MDDSRKNVLIPQLYDGLDILTPTIIYYKPIELDPVYQNKLHDNIETTLAKRPSSKLNKEIHKLNQENRIKIAFGSKYLKANDYVFGISSSSGNKLHDIKVDIFKCQLENDDPTQILSKYLDIKHKQLENKVINDITKVEEIEKELKDALDSIINSIDYMVFVEEAYYIYMKFLLLNGIRQNKKLRYDIVDIGLYHFLVMYTNIIKRTGKKFTKEELDVLRIILYYGFLTQYSSLSSSKVMNLLGTIFDKNIIKQIKISIPEYSKYTGFEGIPALLASMNLVNVTQAFIESAIQRMYGHNILKAYNTDFLSVMTYIGISDECPNICDYKEPKELQNIVMDIKQKILNCKRYITIV